jgi:hypothetical protein
MLRTPSKLHDEVLHSQEREGAGGHTLTGTRVGALEYLKIINY